MWQLGGVCACVCVTLGLEQEVFRANAMKRNTNMDTGSEQILQR